MKSKLSLACMLIVALLGGCASGPSFSTYSGSIPPLDSQKARFYFYRSTLLGGAIQPAVRINGTEVGDAKPHGAFYYDVAPGEYQVETSTEVTRSLTLKLEKGDVRYVRLNVSMGFMVAHIYPELVDADVGSKEILDCKYSGMNK